MYATQDDAAAQTTSAVMRRSRSRLNYGTVSMTNSLLLFTDPLLLLLAGLLIGVLYSQGQAAPLAGSALGSDFSRVALLAAVLAPFFLYDRRFSAAASRDPIRRMLRAHALRFAVLSAAVLALGSLSRSLGPLSPAWLLAWLAAGLLVTALPRLLVALYLGYLQRRGVLTEVIAIVGDRAATDRLVHALGQAPPNTIELLGVFDDSAGEDVNGSSPVGSLGQLLELGKARRIDWILLALAPAQEQRAQSLVQRLKALSAPIGLYTQHLSLATPARSIGYVANTLPVGLLADRPANRWNAVVGRSEAFLPRWIVTLTALAIGGLRIGIDKLVRPARTVPRGRTERLILALDDLDLDAFLDVAARFGQDRFGFAVTPNADHMIRLHDDASFRASYAAASYVLFDSRLIAHLLHVTRGMRLPVCTGSDLTARLFADVVAPDDSLVLIGGSQAQAQQLRARHGLRNLSHFDPPMGFIHDPAAVDACLGFIEAHSPFRFCLLAVGAPQQEAIAQRLQSRGIARGLALCVGGSINFLTGGEQRAPRLLQRAGLEWLHRLALDPGRMAHRYLVRGPRIFGLLRHAQITLRKQTPPDLRLVPSTTRTEVSDGVAAVDGVPALQPTRPAHPPRAVSGPN